MKKNNHIKGIELYFENCENVVIPVQYIESLSIKHGEVLTRVFDGEALSEQYTSDVRIVLTKEISKLETVKHMSSELFVLDRIRKYHDITSITLCYKNKEEEIYVVPWHEDSQINNWQDGVEDCEGNYIITIKENYQCKQ